MHSFSFDRAAPFYDNTRGLPDDISAKITRLILELAPAHRPLLECGIGTGRIAAPLLRRGAHVIGIDLSVEMMRRLREKVAGSPLAQADASRLPFPNASFGLLVTVHLLHLVGPWREALREFRRVLRPGGIYLNSHNDRPADSPNARLRAQWHTLLEARGWSWRRPGAQDHGEIVAELRRMGARVDESFVGQWTHAFTPQQELDQIEARTHSDSWRVPDEALAESLVELRAWATGAYGDLHKPIPIERRFNFDVIHF